MKKSIYAAPAQIPPRPKSSVLYGHGSRQYAKERLNPMLKKNDQRLSSPKRIPSPERGTKYAHRPEDPTLGYTGHYPKYLAPEANMHEFDLIPNRPTRYYTPGFSGFVPQVKAENVFGQSYGKISGMSR